MYEKELELIDKIEIEKQNHGDVEQSLVKAYFDVGEIGDLCEAIAKMSPATEKGWRFYYETLSKDQMFKVYWFLKKTAEDDKLPPEINLACELTFKLLQDVLALPCAINNRAEEEGHLAAVEEVLEFYISVDDFDKAHEFTHEIMFDVLSSEDVGGFSHKISVN